MSLRLSYASAGLSAQQQCCACHVGNCEVHTAHLRTIQQQLALHRALYKPSTRMPNKKLDKLAQACNHCSAAFATVAQLAQPLLENHTFSLNFSLSAASGCNGPLRLQTIVPLGVPGYRHCYCCMVQDMPDHPLESQRG